MIPQRIKFSELNTSPITLDSDYIPVIRQNNIPSGSYSIYRSNISSFRKNMIRSEEHTSELQSH